MAMFRKMVARNGFEGELAKRLAKGVVLDLPAVDLPEQAIDAVVESFHNDLRWRTDYLTLDEDTVEFYEVDELIDGEFVVVGWEFLADGYENFYFLNDCDN